MEKLVSSQFNGNLAIADSSAKLLFTNLIYFYFLFLLNLLTIRVCGWQKNKKHHPTMRPMKHSNHTQLTYRIGLTT